MLNTNKKVVVVGGGFGGVSVANSLKNFEVTLISKQRHFLFTPLLHEVATGNLTPSNIIEPLSEMFDKTNVGFIHDNVVKVNFADKTVLVEKDSLPLKYDYLVLAAGASSNYSINGSREYGYLLKTLDDAIKLKSKILALFKEAGGQKDLESQKKLLNFLIIGGGPTAFEVATELEEYICGTLAQIYQNTVSRDSISITLISSGQEILKQFAPSIRVNAVKVLKNKKINLILNSPVSSINKDSITLSSSEILSSSCTICLSGVTPETLDGSEALEKTASGRIMVDDYQRLSNYPDVYVLGDMSCFFQDKKPLPMLAQVASAQAKNVSLNITRSVKNLPLIKFNYKSNGELVSMGKFNAAGIIMGIPINGVFAWFIWRTVYLLKFPSWSKRFKIMKEWTINLFSRRDVLDITVF